MSEFQPLSKKQIETDQGISKLNDMLNQLFVSGRSVAFLYSLSASTSADAYAKWGEVPASSSIGLRMPAKGSIVRHSTLMNVTSASSGDITAEVRINDSNQSVLELEFNSSDGTGVASKNEGVDRHEVSFSKGDLIQIFLNETGTMVWESVIGHIEVIFDDEE